MSRRPSAPAGAELPRPSSDDPTDAHGAPLPRSPRDEEGSGASYRTGSEYPLVDDENQAPLDADGENPDLYGEDDELPAGPEDVDEPSLAHAPVNETRVAPLEEIEAELDDNPEATRTGPAVKVEVFAGPDSGQVKRFKSVRMVIGRAKGCDVELSDQSVSRRHVELVHGEKGVLLRDLGSGNGTRVNGEKVAEHLLKHGDEIALGKTRLRLAYERPPVEPEPESEPEDSGPAAPPLETGVPEESEAEDSGLSSEVGNPSALFEEGEESAAPSAAGAPGAREAEPRLLLGLPRSELRTLGMVVGGVALLLLLLAGWLVLRPDPGWKDSQVKMAAAQAAFDKGNYAEALHWIEAAELLHAEADAKAKLADRVIEQLRLSESLEEVDALLQKEQLAEAQALLEKLPKAANRNAQERQRLEADLRARLAEQRARSADELLDRGNLAAARGLIPDLPPEFQAPLKARISALEATAVQEAHAREQRQASAARRAKQQRAISVSAVFSAVERKFHQGEYGRAVLECDRVMDEYPDDAEVRQRARELKSFIPVFARNLDDSERKMRANALEAAVRPLRKALEAYRKIGFAGSISQTLDAQLASASLVAGQASLARGDLRGAKTHFQEAARLRPDDGRARTGLQELQVKVEALYRDAYSRKGSDPAAASKMFRTVVDTAASESKIKSEAERQLEQLSL